MATTTRVLPTTTPTLPPPTAVVPVDDEPLHRERWRSDVLRIVDVQFPPRTTSLWHQHVHYGIYICLTPIDAFEQSPTDAAPRRLAQPQGAVFCRDHVLDRLVHVVSTRADPMRIIEVEILRDCHLHGDEGQYEAAVAAAKSRPPLTAHPSATLLHAPPQCRVHRLELEVTTTQGPLELVLPTHAVLIALADCRLGLRNPAAVVADNDSIEDTPGERLPVVALAAGADVVLAAGPLTLQALDNDNGDSVKDAKGIVRLILCEIFSA